MSGLPRISVVTPSFNQGAFIRETIESVLAQGYPDVEHIVVDGMSSDDTCAILAGYPHLRVVREPDSGQAEAINKGFRLATGGVFCFLNSDDTFLPGALERVAREIDPARGRHIVMGRCRFIDEKSRYGGIEHPSHFESFARVLKIWKGHTIPQPAVFFTRQVWEQCGPLDPALKYHLDYDLFCRFARRYRFHFVDQPMATYRLHAESKTVAWTEAERLEDSIRLSRRYWGSRLRPLYWELALSLAWHRLDRLGRANRLYLRGVELGRNRRPVRGLARKAAAGLLAPELIFYASAFPLLKRVFKTAADALIERLAGGVPPQTAVYLDRDLLWDDGWAGPRLALERESRAGRQKLVLTGTAHPDYMSGPLWLAVRVDGTEIGRVEVRANGFFSRAIAVPTPLEAGLHKVEIQANRFVVYHRVLRNGDYRPLSWLPAGAEGIVFRSAE